MSLVGALRIVSGTGGVPVRTMSCLVFISLTYGALLLGAQARYTAA